ncbi:MAG: transposase [Acidobacteria bacterium]|nr:transposase [Acidobacteriota bacterium]
MLRDDIPIQIKRRHLPHWTLPGVTYYVTFRLHSRPLVTQEILLVRQHIRSSHNRYYHLYATQVMPDHVHLLLRPYEDYSLSRILKGIKGVTARKLNLRRGRNGSLWQDESFDRIIRNRKEFWQKLDYMFRNPVTAGLTEEPLAYPGWYLNEEEDE